VSSVQAAVRSLLLTHELARQTWENDGGGALNLPGLRLTPAQMLEGLARVAGPEAAARVALRPDAALQSLTEGWATRFATHRAAALGFQSDPDFESILRAHLSAAQAVQQEPR
jgi:hypothetical protein